MSLERDIIERLRQKTRDAGEIPGLGIGDDAAFLVVSSLDHDKLIITTDSMVEGVHYDPRYCSYGDVAAKLYEMNASDVLAKGGDPRWALLNLNLTRKLASDAKALEDFVDVLADKFIESGVALIGGDTTASDVNTFTITLLGCGHDFIRRKNESVKRGDLVVVAGELGGSSHALSLWQKGETPSPEVAFAYRRPKACWDNLWLHQLEAKASIDQSDSVLETLQLLSRGAGMSIEAVIDDFPLLPVLTTLPEEELISAALAAAEDLALFAIVPSTMKAAIKANPMLHCIGKLTGKGEGVKILYKKKEVDLSRYRQFHHFE